jgi:hypothetical protein
LFSHNTGCVLEKEKKCRWMKEWLKKRNLYTHENLLRNLTLSEPGVFQIFLRLDAKSLDELLKMIAPRIEKKEYYYVRYYSSKPASVLF